MVFLSWWNRGMEGRCQSSVPCRPASSAQVSLNVSKIKMFEKCSFLGPNESVAWVGSGICILRMHPNGVRCRWSSKDTLGNVALLVSQKLSHWPPEILKGSTLGSTSTLVGKKDTFEWLISFSPLWLCRLYQFSDLNGYLDSQNFESADLKNKEQQIMILNHMESKWKWPSLPLICRLLHWPP